MPVLSATRRSVWLPYLGLCFLGWMLYAVAGTDLQRGEWRAWAALYEATWNLGPPMLLGVALHPWARWLATLRCSLLPRLGLHVVAALAFLAAWHALDFGLALGLYGADHAMATLQQGLLWRSAWAVFLYIALFLGFAGVIDARRARDAAMSAAQAESALVRAELAAITGKLNPHFLFNTLNSIAFLVRKDARAAEQALQSFSRMMRYLLDAKRDVTDRVALRDELDFVRDYLELESLRLGARLTVQWDVDDGVLNHPIPPLTLQPLVENSIVHGVAPRVEGGKVRVSAQQQMQPAGLRLTVSDDGRGCEWPASAPPGRAGVGLSALQRRFEVDYGGRAHLHVHSAPGAGFHVEIFIPVQDEPR